MDPEKIALDYCNAVKSGEIVSGRWVKMACERFERDCRRTDIYFDPDSAALALDFFAGLKLWKGSEYRGKPFVLAPHYQFIVINLFGWKKYKNGPRRFSTAYLEMARKGAKTTFAGGVGAYMFAADNEPGAECYAAATARDQASKAWENIKNLLETSMFRQEVTSYRYHLEIEDLNSICRPLSSDTKSMDGHDTHFCSLDELHAHPDPRVHDLMVDSIGARLQPLIFIITTAGFDQAGICYQRREYLAGILKRMWDDDSFFGMIFTLDQKRDFPDLLTKQEVLDGKGGETEDDWADEDLWAKANPGLCGITAGGKRFGMDDDGKPLPGYMTKIGPLRDAAKYAKANPAAQNNFMTKRLNIWTQQHTRWLDLDLWDQNNSGDVYVIV